MYIVDQLLTYPSPLIKLNKTLNKKGKNLPYQHLLTYKNLIYGLLKKKENMSQIVI